MRRLALITLIAFLALAGAAQANPMSPELERDYYGALAWWHVSSPPQCSTVTLGEEWMSPFPPEIAADVIAASTQPEPGTVGPCTLTFYEDDQPRGKCANRISARHEVGHLLGYGHTPDEPRNIMAPEADLEYWCPSEFEITVHFVVRPVARRETLVDPAERKR